jgi:lipoprotein-anchoring transpeptidase ErfK/SrfK
MSTSLKPGQLVTVGHIIAAGTARSRARARRARPGYLAAAALAVAGGLLVSACSGQPAASARASSAASPAALPVGAALLATLRATVPRYGGPGGVAAGRVPGTWYGARSTLPVVATRPGWVRVRLAQRPNGSTAWVPSSDVSLSATPYRIVVNLATTHLTLYKDDRPVFSTPAGVGTRTYPTPTGQYFVAFLEAPPKSDPGYGAFIMVISAHSDAISNWEGSGDAVIGIHGPLGSDKEIGTTGARISHGCIRLHEPDLLRLRDVPPGSPVDIVG